MLSFQAATRQIRHLVITLRGQSTPGQRAGAIYVIKNTEGLRRCVYRMLHLQFVWCTTPPDLGRATARVVSEATAKCSE